MLAVWKSQHSPIITFCRQISVLYFGSDRFSKSCLEALDLNRKESEDNDNTVKQLQVVCLPEKRSKLPVKRYAQENGIPVITWPDLPSHKFDIGVVVSFGQLIPKSVIQSFKYGMINVHGSLLPRWRGASPFMQAILAGDGETGISIMEIQPGKFDHGRILALSETVKIEPYWTSEDLSIALEDIASDCLLMCLKNIECYIKNAVEQDNGSATYAPKVTADDCIVAWEAMTSTEIYRRYLAFGFRKDYLLKTNFEGKSVGLQKVCPLEEEERAALDRMLNKSNVESVPGSIVYLKKFETLCVTCKDGHLGVKKLVIGKPITARDFYNSSVQTRLKVGKSVKFC